MSQFKRWVKEFWNWLAEAKLVFMCGLLILAAILSSFFTWPSEDSIRIAGYFLQLIGMVFAIRGLLLVRSHFGQQSLRGLSLKWLKRIPKWKRGAVVRVGSAFSTSVAMDPHVEVWAPDDPEKALEHRLNAVVKNLGQLRSDQRVNTQLIDNLRGDYENHKVQVWKENIKIQENVRADLESLHTSDLVTSIVGLVWLLVGITMSTLAPELSLWVRA